MNTSRWFALFAGIVRHYAGHLVIAALLPALSACNVYDVASSEQALGRYLGVGAWLDPTLEPLSGCAALEGDWSNRGNLIRDDSIKTSVFAAAVGIAADYPDSPFSDRVRLSRTDDGGLTVTFFTLEREIAAVQIAAADLQCANSSFAELRYHDRHRLSVDASGGLWVDEHRYPRPGALRCRSAGSWTQVSADGMATVIAGGTATLAEPHDPTQRILVRAPIHGVRVIATATFLLPGERRIPARVWFQPKSEWSWNVPSAAGELEATLEDCHVYVVLGHGLSVGEASLAIVDLGDSFNWRECHLVKDQYRRARFDGQELTVSETCFATDDQDWHARSKMPKRVIPVPPQVLLTPEADPEQNVKPDN